MAATTAAATEVPEDVTAELEASDQESETATQEEARIREYVDALKQAEESLKETATKLRAERDEAINRAKELETTYTGLQRSSTKKLQELSELKKEMQRTKATEERLDRMEGLLSNMARDLLPNETWERMELENQRAEVARQKAALSVPAAQPDAEYAESDDHRKVRLFRDYFPTSSLDPLDPRLDWAPPDEAPSFEEWMTRISASIIKTEREDSGKRAAQEAEGLVQAAQERVQTADELAAEQIKAAREKLEEDRTRIREEERLRKEEKLREMGADVSDNAISEERQRRSLSEAIPVNEKEWIKPGDPMGIARLEKALNARRSKIRSQFRRNPNSDY